MLKRAGSIRKHLVVTAAVMMTLFGTMTSQAKTIKAGDVAISYLANTKGQIRTTFSQTSSQYLPLNCSVVNYDSDLAKKPKNIKSSNTKVVTTALYKYTEKSSDGETNTYYYLYGIGKKPGKATVSYKIGKDTYKVPVKVVKYKAPFSSLKINGKEYASKIKNSRTITLSYSKYKGKTVTLSAKKQGVFKEVAEGWPYFYGNLSKKSGTFKNGGYDKFKFKVTKKGCGVQAWVRRSDVAYAWESVYIVFK